MLITQPYLIVLNITTDCNLHCIYCYAKAGDKRDYMSVDCAYKILENVCSLSNRNINVLFHGGEPLLNFHMIRGLINKVEHSTFHRRINYFIQTNSVSVNEEIARYLYDKRIRISISLDGYNNISNGCRILKDGEQAFNKIMEGVRILKSEGNELNGLCVLTKKNYKNIRELIDFFVENDITQFAVNYFLPGGRGEVHSELAVDPAQIFEVTKNILERIKHYNSHIHNRRKVMERNIYYLIKGIKLQKKAFMCMNSPCGAGNCLLGFTPNGDIYPCDDFSGVEEFRIGNINDGHIGELLTNNEVLKYFNACYYHKIERCKECDIQVECGSGCAARKFFTNGNIYTRDPLCEFYKMFISYIKDEIKNGRIDIGLF